MSAELDYAWYHIYPTNDLGEHLLSSAGGVDVMSCPCKPTFDAEHNTVIHNSFDGREQYESGQGKLPQWH